MKIFHLCWDHQLHDHVVKATAYCRLIWQSLLQPSHKGNGVPKLTCSYRPKLPQNHTDLGANASQGPWRTCCKREPQSRKRKFLSRLQRSLKFPWAQRSWCTFPWNSSTFIHVAKLELYNQIICIQRTEILMIISAEHQNSNPWGCCTHANVFSSLQTPYSPYSTFFTTLLGIENVPVLRGEKLTDPF